MSHWPQWLYILSSIELLGYNSMHLGIAFAMIWFFPPESLQNIKIMK